jgi:hypothetical protein
MQSSVAPAREIGAWCDFRGSLLGLEPGVLSNPLTCDAAAVILSEYLDAYESRWQKVPELPEWTPGGGRAANAGEGGHFFAGQTFWASKTIDIYQGSLSVLPHEVHHVALGPSSGSHQGWCPFGDWEAEEGILEELDYLGCSPPAK